MKYHPQTHISLRPNLGVLQIDIKSQDIVMSNSEDSTVTYMAAPPSPDYVLGPEEPKQAPPLLEFVPEPVYREFMPPEDDILLAEEQPLPAAVSPTSDSPGYIPESDPEEDPKEDDDEDPEEDPTDYPTDRDDDNDEEEPSGDEADDKEEDEDDEEEHTTPADSIPPLVHHVTARISIRAQTSVSLPLDTEVAKLLTIPTPPPSPHSPWSSPLPQIPSPPLPVSSPVPVLPSPLPTSPTYPLGYRAAVIRLRAETPSTSHPLPSSTSSSGTPPLLPIPLPTPSPPLLLPSTDCRGGVFEVGKSSSTPTARPTRGFRTDYGFVATLDEEIRRDPKREVGYGITDTWDEMLVGMPRALATDETELLMSDRLNTLFRDRRAHAHTALLMERDSRLSREAWGWSMDASDLTCSEVMALRTQIHVTALHSQLGPTSGPTQPEIPEEADSSS
ncbi:hypothetical protein Tco_1362573 [Tanacetum coccineum]